MCGSFFLVKAIVSPNPKHIDIPATDVKNIISENKNIQTLNRLYYFYVHNFIYLLNVLRPPFCKTNYIKSNSSARKVLVLGKYSFTCIWTACVLSFHNVCVYQWSFRILHVNQVITSNRFPIICYEISHDPRWAHVITGRRSRRAVIINHGQWTPKSARTLNQSLYFTGYSIWVHWNIVYRLQSQI